MAATLGLLIATQASAGPPQAAHATDRPDGDALLRLIIERGWVSLDAAKQGVQDARRSASDLVILAMNFLDRAYRFGGSTAADGFDCSGFVSYVFRASAGLVLPRRSHEQASADGVVPVAADELQPGDLVFFNTLRRAFSHVGIYIGDGKFIHAPRAGSTVRIEDMRTAYWSRRFDGARRVALLDAAGGVAAATTPR